MAKRFTLFSALFLYALFIAPIGYGQEKPKTGVPAKDPGQKAVEEQAPADTSADPALSQAIVLLSQQISGLTQEIKKMRQDSDRHATIMELLLSEERLQRIEDKIANAITYKAQLDAREQDVLRRQKNIQQEITLRGASLPLRREEAEALLKQEFQRVLDETRAQQIATQTKITEMQAEADRLRYRTDLLRQKAQRMEAKPDETAKPPNKE